MGLWLGGAIIVLLSLLVVAELIAMTPKSGGVYALVAHAYGPYPGFLIGWTDWLSTVASAALKAVVLVEYITLLVPSLGPYNLAATLFVTTAFAALQLGGVRLSGGVYQGASAGFGLIIISVTVALMYGALSGDTQQSVPVVAQAAQPDLAKYGLVAAAIVFTYDGWTGASYFGGEIKGGGRMVAMGSIRGVLIVIFLYLLLNSALVFSVPLAVLQGDQLALAGALQYLFGDGAGVLIVFAAIFILLAHQNSQYMLSTRILYALSCDGMGSEKATTVSDKGTPTGSLFFTWLLTVGLILAGGFGFLLNMAALLFIMMYVALIFGVFRLRRQEPDAARPYRAWGFPFTAYFCGGFWIVVAAYMAFMDQRSTLYALGLITVSIPAFLLLNSRRQLGAAVH
jgi:APA family basic amino acid/polyamine antiporter